ncbi:unnamed protein product [Closterium sp. NIES-65]|nr:unnamed protein product [Closterium sp. NIES-65]
MRREAKLAAKDRAENCDMREVLKRAAVRLKDCAASMKGVVVDSMENAQKKLTDEGKESHEVAEKEAGKRVAEKETVKRETGKKAVDKDTGKRVADKDTRKGESRREGKRQKGPVATSVTDLLKIGGAVVVRLAGTTRVDAGAGPPPAPSAVEAAKGKDKVKDATPNTTPTTTANTTAIVPAGGNTSVVADGQPGPSSIAPAIPPSVDLKEKNQGRSGCKPPPAALKAEHEDDDDSDENDVVELVWQRFMGPSDTSGTSGKRKGCGIHPPPRVGEGMVGEPWLGGRRRWLGHHSLEEVQYLTAIAVMCYDKKIDPRLKLTAQQRSEWAEDISATGMMCTGLFATMHLRNLWGNAYHDFTRPGSTLGNTVAWAAAVGKEAADEERDVTGDQVGLFAGAVACAIAMVWETCNGLDLEGVMDAGYGAAQCASTPEEKARGHVSIVTAVFKWAKKECARKQAPKGTPKKIAEKIETAVVNRLGARLGDPTLVGMVAH